MYVQPVVVPVKLLRKPAQESLFISADSREERTHVVRAKHVGVLDGEGSKHIKRFSCFPGDLFDAIDGSFHPIDHVSCSAATPSWSRAIEKRRRFLRGGVEHRNIKLFKSRCGNRTRFHAGGNFVDEFEARILFLEML